MHTRTKRTCNPRLGAMNSKLSTASLIAGLTVGLFASPLEAQDNLTIKCGKLIIAPGRYNESVILDKRIRVKPLSGKVIIGD